MEYITQTKISREWYTLITSNLHNHVLRVILHLKQPSLCSETSVYIPVPKTLFCRSSFLCQYGNFKLYFLVSIRCTGPDKVQNCLCFILTLQILELNNQNEVANEVAINFVQASQASISSCPTPTSASR